MIFIFTFLQAYLRNFYGYQSTLGRQKRSAGAGEDADWSTGLCDAVKTMQRFFGLPQSGELTKETLAVMKKPRCGLSDVEQFGNTVRWKKTTLSYRFDNNQEASCVRLSHIPQH